MAITNTHTVGIAHAAIIAWTVKHHPWLADAWLLPVAAETWDGYLNDINGGSGTASRLVGYADTTYSVGVFVQANFGGREELTIAGLSVGQLLADDNPMAEYFATPEGAGSVIAIVATDAPLLPHQCTALARRVTLGLARTGTTGSHFSGDLFLAFSTASPGGITPDVTSFRPGAEGRYDQLRSIPWGYLDPFYAAVVQATGEAVLNALIANEDMTGRAGHRTPALPRDRLAKLMSTRSVPPGTDARP